MGLVDITPDLASERFQALIEFKYTRGLTIAEEAELLRLEALLEERDARFYRAILDRLSGRPT